MTWLLSLLGTKAGRTLAVSAGAVFLLAGFWIAGDVHGHRKQAAKDQAKITAVQAQMQAVQAANVANQATIAKLKDANLTWAAQAAASEARAKQAATDQAKAETAATAKLTAAQTKLREALHDKTNPVDLAAVPLGPAVRSELCQHVTCTH